MSNQLDSAAEAQATLARATEQQEAAQQAAERALSDTEAALQAAVLQRDASISELEGLQQALQRAEAGRRSVEEELQLKANENVALSDDLANLTRENQAVNAELMSATGERDQCRQNMAAMEVRVQNAESQIAMKDTERTELLAAYRQLHDSNAQLLEAAQQAEREGEHSRAASQAELVATRGAAADLEANHLLHDDQLATFRQQSQGARVRRDPLIGWMAAVVRGTLG
jgi:chromosome segregation ATPase